MELLKSNVDRWNCKHLEMITLQGNIVSFSDLPASREIKKNIWMSLNNGINNTSVKREVTPSDRVCLDRQFRKKLFQLASTKSGKGIMTN